MSNTVPAAFLSYAHVDNERDKQYITKLGEMLQGEVRARTAPHDFVIFQDWRDIRWGQQWKERIGQTIDSANFLIPILSPSFFASPECRQEVELFLKRENALNRNDLILPIYYIDHPPLNTATAAQHDPLAQLFNARQRTDWRKLRLKPLDSQKVLQVVFALAQSIRDVIFSNESFTVPYTTIMKLKDLLQQLSISADRLRSLCREVIPPNGLIPIPANLDSLGLLQWLDDRGQLSGGQVPLLDMLHKLLPSVSDATARNCLEQCIGEVASHFKADSKKTPKTATTRSEDNSALMLEIWPNTYPGKRCNVQGWLFDASKGIAPVYPPVETENPEAPLDLSNPVERTGLVENLRRIIEESGLIETEVILEFILPWELLSQAVEHWTDKAGEPIGTYSPVVVRPRERLLRKPTPLHLNRWNTLLTSGDSTLLRRLWPFEKSQWLQVRDKLEEGCCIALRFVPDLIAPVEQHDVQYLLSVGTPVVLWPRQKEIDFKLEFQEVADSRSPQDPLGIIDLPKIVCKRRRQLCVEEKQADHCYHFTLLWDDPTRRPPPPPNPERDDEYYQAPV